MTKTRQVVAGVVSVAALSALLLASWGGVTLAASPRASAHHATSAPAASVSEEDIVKFLLGLAKDPAKNFIMKQLGLPTTAPELTAISNKIDALSRQLTAAEIRLSTQLNELGLQGRIDYLKDQAANLNSLYRDYFHPLVVALINVKVQQEKSPPDQAAINAAISDYNVHKTEFQSFANSIQLTTIAEKIHNRLQPGFDGVGVLRQYGTDIMVKRRIVNFSDSRRVEAMYAYFEGYQALAAWMTVERAYAVGGSSEATVTTTLDQFFEWQKQQRDPNAPNGLLPQIPSGTAIDTHLDQSSPAFSTQNAPMYTYIAGTYAYAPFSSFTPPIPTVQTAVAAARSSKLEGFDGWGVPSEAQIDGLFSGLGPASSASIATYIGNTFDHPNIAIPRPWIWLSNTSPQHYCWQLANKKLHCTTSDSHRGKSTDDFSSNVHPVINYYGGPAPDIAGRYRDAQGGLVLVRSTGDQAYL